MIDKISIVLPVFNEEDNIENVVTNMLLSFNAVFSSYEIIIVNDGSTDASSRIMERLAKAYDNVRVINFEHNKGYGAALREGFKNASFDHIFYTDSDGQFDVGEIAGMVLLMDRCDIAAGFRSKRKDGINRLVSSWVYNKLVSLLFGIRVRDVNCAFKLFKKDILDKITLFSSGFSIGAELLWKAGLSGCRICEFGVSHLPRQKGRSKVGITDIVRTARELIDIKRKGAGHKGAVPAGQR